MAVVKETRHTKFPYFVTVETLNSAEWKSTLAISGFSLRNWSSHSVVKLNIGCGEYLSEGWINIDSDPRIPADLHAIVPPIPFEDNSVDEIAAVHFLEHLERDVATEFLKECHRVLKPGHRLGIVVPDTYAVCSEYVNRTGVCVELPYKTLRSVNDLDTLCDLFFYSTIQPSPHKWSWDLRTLYRALVEANFSPTGEIDRWNDPRLGSGQWYQCGLNAIKVTNRVAFTNEKADEMELVRV